MLISRDTVPPPRFVFMEVNKRCNLRCQHCDFWQRKEDRENYLSLDRKHQILGEFAAMNPNGTLVICGGEPMLDLEDYFGHCAAARDHGLKIVSVVNGTRIRRPEVARRLMEEGPHEISISLNSHDRALHDRTRGVKGAFDRAVSALRLLVDAKRDFGSDASRVYVMGLIFASNYRDVAKFYDFVLNDIGADQLKLNFLQPSFGRSGTVDPFYRDESGVDGDELEVLLRDCDERFNLGLNPAWIAAAGMYFRSLPGIGDIERGWKSASGTKEHICNTYERNVMINHYGEARLCFAGDFPGRRLEKPGDFTKFWQSTNALRAKMRNCNRFCGISHSVRKESSTLKGRAKLEEHENQYGAFPAPRLVDQVLRGFLHTPAR